MAFRMKLAGLCVLALLLPAGAQAQGYTRTETIEYHDNTTLWVLGQTAKVTCVAPAECTPAGSPGGIVMSETTYNTLAQPVTVKSYGATVQTLTYHPDGTIATVKDGNNNVTTLGNWKRGIPQSIGFADGQSMSASVNNNGWLDWTEDENDSRTCYTYDAMGRLASITYPKEAAANICNEDDWNKTTQVFQQIAGAEYGIPAGHWRQVVATGNGQKITYFDALWRPLLTKELDATNGTSETLTKKFQRFAYDAEGRVAFASYPGLTDSLSTGTWTLYDALGRVTSVSQDTELSGPATTLTEYLPGFKTRVTNPRGQSTLTIYQTFDLPTYDFPAGIDHPEGASTEIYRDAFGKVTALRRRNTTAPFTQEVWRRYVYDAQQRLCKSIEPETGASLYLYDAAGNLSYSASGLNLPDPTSCNVEPGRPAIARTYDARNRLQTLSFPDGHGNQTWTYTADGKPFSITTDNPGGAQVVNIYNYFRRGLLKAESITQPGWYSWGVGYGYSGQGHLSTLAYPTGLVVAYSPNALGQPTQVRDQANQAYATGIQYHPNGAIKQFTYGNGIVHTMTQNARQLPARSIDSGGVLDNEYTYDPNANVQYIHDWRDPSLHRYLYYDGLDRLTSAGSQMFGGDHWHRFTYNALDNLTSWKLAGVKDYATYNYDASNRLTSIQNSAGATVVGLSYDAQGNLSNKNGQAYVFDLGNRLRAVTNKESYRYDGLGRRITITDATGYTLPMYSQSGQVMYVGDYRRNVGEENIYLGGSLLAIREYDIPAAITTILYQHTDALGSPVAVTNAAGQVTKRNSYEPYGGVISQPNYGGIGYTGHVQDAATGLTYMQQRYYDPTIGRFLSVDPVTAYSNPVGAFNRYWYANNNPYKFTDPDGRQVVCDESRCSGTVRNRLDELYVLAVYVNRVIENAIVNTITQPGIQIPEETIGDLTQSNESQTADREPGADGKRGSTGGPGEGKRFPQESPDTKAGKEGVPCRYCGQPTTNQPGQPNSRERDHIDPKSRGGNNSPENEGDSCRTCNREKGARNPDEWQPRQR